MKLLHLGDLHLGKSLRDFDLIDDQKYIIEGIIDLVKEKSIDGVLIAGDVYDRAIPSEAAENLLDHLLWELAQLKVSTFLISGNHDSDDRLNFGGRFFKKMNTHIYSVFDGTLHKETVSDENGEVDIYMLPFVKASQVRHFFPDEKIESYEDAVKVIIDHTDIDISRRNVIVAHQFVTGKSSDPACSGSEGIGTISVGTVEKVGYDVFDKFDYVALGHIHSPQYVGREEIRYAGSPLKYSLSEVNNKKTIPVVTLGEKGKVDVELVPVKPMRELRHIKGELSNLLLPENVSDTEDFIYVTLTNEDIIENAIDILRGTYPNVLMLDYDNSHSKKKESIDVSQITTNRSFDELISDFYKFVYGTDISDEEMDIMKKVAEEEKIIEAD